MKLKSLFSFPLLAGLMACWILLSEVQAATGLPASEYEPRSGELTPREMAIAKNAWQYFVSNYQCGKQVSLNHYVGQRLLYGCDDGSTGVRDY